MAKAKKSGKKVEKKSAKKNNLAKTKKASGKSKKALAPKAKTSLKAKKTKASAKNVTKATSASKKPLASAVPQKRVPVSSKPTLPLDHHLSPLRDRVLVERAGESNMTPGGLYIPGTVEDKPQLGKVVAIGTGALSKKGQVRPLDVKVGDQIVFGKFSGTEIKLEGQDFVLLREDEILGVRVE